MQPIFWTTGLKEHRTSRKYVIPPKTQARAYISFLNISGVSLIHETQVKHRDGYLFHHMRYIMLFPIPVNLSNWRSEALLAFNSINTDLLISSGNC